MSLTWHTTFNVKATAEEKIFSEWSYFWACFLLNAVIWQYKNLVQLYVPLQFEDTSMVYSSIWSLATLILFHFHYMEKATAWIFLGELFYKKYDTVILVHYFISKMWAKKTHRSRNTVLCELFFKQLHDVKEVGQNQWPVIRTER